MFYIYWSKSKWKYVFFQFERHDQVLIIFWILVPIAEEGVG